MTRGTGEPTPERRPLSVGTGNTGNPCEYPGCTDKNASLSTLWERPDQDHDFGGTNRALRCREHWGLEAPRVPRPREPLPTDPGWKVIRREPARDLRGARSQGPERRPGPGQKAAKRKRSLKGRSGQSQSITDRGGAASRRPVDMAKLNHLCRRAKELLPSDPGRAAEVCARALEQEKAAVASTGPRAQELMDTFRLLRRKALEAVRARGPLPPSLKVEPVEEEQAPPAPTTKRGMAGLSTRELKEFERRYHSAKRMAAQQPERAISLCNAALAMLAPRSGTKALRDLFQGVRTEARRNGRKKRR